MVRFGLIICYWFGLIEPWVGMMMKCLYVCNWLKNQDDELWLAKMLSVLYLAWMYALMMIWWCEFDANWEGVIGLSGLLFMVSCLGYHHYMVCVHSCIHESTWAMSPMT